MIRNSILRTAAVLVMCLFWAAVFGLLLGAALSAADSNPTLAGLIGLVLVGLACWLAAVSLK